MYMYAIKKTSTQVVMEMTEGESRYIILENGDVLSIKNPKLWKKAKEVKDINGALCVKLINGNNQAEYFRKSDLKNGMFCKVSDSEIRKHKNEKRVGMYKDGLLIRVFSSANAAFRETGISQPSIYNCCNNIRYCKTAGGYEWRYE